MITPAYQGQWKEPGKDTISPPASRRLRGYAFDPSLSMQMETALVNETIFKVDWEELEKGPIGEYIEVIDFDPASGCFYDPVNLNDPLILAQDGLSPSEGNPHFHQQMVYAVAMTTLRNFERATGRWALWSPHKSHTKDGDIMEEFVSRLRIYPHALREANAYYSPAKKALLFGYFPASIKNPGEHFPGGMVFTCLSHDIIAHETTHALLDGMHERFIEPNHQDSLAFHEAFADIVALFQHFSFEEVLQHQIAKTRGDLGSQSLLGELAQQFGKAIGHYGALRNAIGQINPKTGKWEQLKPNPQDYQTVMEPHARGAILVAAIFDAFLSIYKSRVADLLRIATSGTGILPEGALHPDLVNRLAREAAKAAQHILNMCIRALDYCPPVDINFGDYLRALITADSDLVREDKYGYRIAVIEAFRRRGIYPRDVRTLSVESLRWQGASKEESQEDFGPIAGKMRGFVNLATFFKNRKEDFDKTNFFKSKLHELIQYGLERPEVFERITGLKFSPTKIPAGMGKSQDGKPVFEVHSLRPARRISPDGEMLTQVVVSITQKRAVKDDNGRPFIFRGGCTLILDLDDLELKYSIRKPIDNEQRLKRQQEFRSQQQGFSLRATYFGTANGEPGENHLYEPLALLHRSF